MTSLKALNRTLALALAKAKAKAKALRVSSYDAAYLELAVRQGLPLASLDKNLRRAARNTGVDLYLK
jgi:predicted nucleic acid-binding protein